MRWPGATSRRTGSCSEQSAKAKRQRGAKRQPGAGLIRIGTVPPMVSSRVLCALSRSMRGIERIRPLRVGMARAFEQAVDIGLFHHLAGIHDDDALRGLRHDAHRMGDQHDGHAEAFLHVLQQIEDLRLDGHVERGGRLVGDDELGLAGQRHGDHDALAHAARELVRVIMHAAFRIGNLHQLQHLDCAGQRVFFRQALMAAQAFGDLLADRQHRVERGHRLLEDEADLLGPDVVQFVARERHEIAALEQDLAFDDAARRHRDQLQDRHRRDGLAAAGFADHAERLALVEHDVDAVDRPAACRRRWQSESSGP